MDLSVIILLCFLIVVIITLVIALRRYSFRIVRGTSMLPTLHTWEPVIIKKKYKLKVGKCYMFETHNTEVVKRLAEIKVNPVMGRVTLFFLGDNPDHSYDSRDYGFVSERCVIGEVVKVWGNIDERNGYT